MLRNTIYTTSGKKQFARHLRTQQTNGEKALWRKLRSNRFHGLKFRKQVPIGPYIVDFLCIQKNLIIEIDGDSHHEPGAKQKDAVREAYLREIGFDVLRFSNDAALQSLDWVMTEIAHHIHCSSL